MSKTESAKQPPMAAIVMAAGRGSRMLAKSLPKVCFPVLGVPAINRTLRSCRKVGIASVVVVVGDDGDQVMRTVSDEHEGILYAHQPEPRGTGHAVRTGFEPLRQIGFEGLVWCIVGDKVIEPEAFDRVLRAFDEDADAAFAVTDKPHAEDMGHVLQDSEGRVLGIFERNDLKAARLLQELDEGLRDQRVPDAAQLRRRCLEALGTPDRCERFLSKVWRLAQGRGKLSARRLRAALPERPGRLQAGPEWLAADEILASAPYKNESLYCFRSKTLDRGLKLMPAPKGTRED